MQMLGEDDLDLRNLSDEELDLAWDLWFDLAQTTNDFDPPHTHGVFQLMAEPRTRPERNESGPGALDAARIPARRR